MVSVAEEPCEDHSNWKQYANHAPDVSVRKVAEFNKNKTELLKDPSVQEMPVQSMITKPSPHDILAAAQADSISVKGFAWGGGGQGVARVDVSLDGGNNLTRADLLEKPVQQRRRSEWSWQFFEKNIPIPEEVKEQLKEVKKVELTLTSNTFNTEWNYKYSTACHHCQPLVQAAHHVRPHHRGGRQGGGGRVRQQTLGRKLYNAIQTQLQ